MEAAANRLRAGRRLARTAMDEHSTKSAVGTKGKLVIALVFMELADYPFWGCRNAQIGIRSSVAD